MADVQPKPSPVHLFYFLLLSAAIFIISRILDYWFGNYYCASYEQFKSWHPRFYFLIFPVVKVAPWLFAIGILYLLRKLLFNVFLFCANAFGSLKSLVVANAAGEREHARQLLRALTRKSKTAVSNILLASFAIFLILIPVEFALMKLTDIEPGMRKQSKYFHPVDTLVEMQGFHTDSNGIFRVADEAREFVRSEIAEKKSIFELTPYGKNQTFEVYSLARDFVQLMDTGYRNEFKSFLEKSDASSDTADAELHAAIKEYVRCPINSDGFKGIAFKKYNTKRKSILLLGDSFTWGHVTTNKTNCFGDLLLTKGYVVYNTGITGTDPAQYLQIAKVLIPRLEPDYVVVNFYLGNDIKYFERKPLPHLPVFYCTNAGNIISCPEGVYFRSAQEAYNYTLAVWTIPVEESAFNRFCSKTVLGTMVWRALAKINVVYAKLPQYKDYYDRVNAATLEMPFSDVELHAIRDLTSGHGGKFLLGIIPELSGDKFILPEDHPGIFEGLEYYVPPIRMEHYEAVSDGHFNDKGNAMYADFIDSLIKAQL